MKDMDLDIDNDSIYTVRKIETDEGTGTILGKKTDKGVEMVRTTLSGIEVDNNGILGIPVEVAYSLTNNYYHTDNSVMRILNGDGSFIYLKSVSTTDCKKEGVLLFPKGD